MSIYQNSKVVFILFLIAVLVSIAISITIETNINVSNPNSLKQWVGIETIELTQSIKSQYNIHDSNGLLVSRTFIASPAEAAGIKEGDIIKRFNGISVTSQKQFQKLIYSSIPNKKIKININRDNKPVMAYVRIGIRPGRF